MNSNSLRTLRGQLLREAITLLLFSGLMLQSMQAAAPGWWSTQGVFKPQSQADDYAAANVGQLKAMAAKAAKEMNERLQQGAGNDINGLIASWRSSPTHPRDDYSALTQGQLKRVARLFYDRLAVINGQGQPVYPWGNGAAADDYALANIGQLKTVFAFLLPSMIWRLGDSANPSPDDLNENGISDAYEDSRGWDPDDSEDGPSGLPPLVEAWNNASADVDNGDVIAGVYLNTSGKAGSAVRDDQQTDEELIAEAKENLEENDNSTAQLKIARAGEVGPMMLDYPQQLAAFGAYASSLPSDGNTIRDWYAAGSQVDYSFEYRIPSGITKGLAPFTLNWFEVTRQNDGFPSSSDQLSVVSRSANLLPGTETSTYQFRPFDDFTGGLTWMFTALSGYTCQNGTAQRLTPTTAAPHVYSYVADPDSDVDIDDASQTASITLKGSVWDQLAGALPLGAGADVQTVDIYVNGGLAVEDVPLIHEKSGSRDIAGSYHFDPVTVTFPLAENIVVEVETSENLVGKTTRYTQTFHFDPVLGDAPQVQPRSIHALLQLPSAFSPTAADTITVLPVTGPGSGVAAVETDIDSRVFVTADGYVVSVPDGYVGTSTAQTIQCFIPTGGAGGSGSTGVLVPGGSSVTCSETGSGTNRYAYSEDTEGFELPAPVVEWTYDDVLDSSWDDADGDYAPFSYFVSGPFKTGELKITPFQGAPQLNADSGMPYFQNGRSFEAFIIPNADGTGYDLLYANHDTGTVTRAPFSGTLTAQVQVGSANASGGSIGLWTLEWEDLDGQPSSGPNKMTADALASYVARADHDGIEIPDDFCARVAVKGLLPGYGIEVESSEEIDSFILLPPEQMPTGNAIVSRLAPLESSGGTNWRSQHKIIIYQSSPEVDRLTDPEWNALKDAGYIAVHNFSAIASIVALGANGVSGAAVVSALDDHHLFQTFRGSKDPVYTAAKVAKFWESLGITPNDYTAPWDKATHISSHKLNNPQITGITARWKNFFSNYMSPSGAFDLSKGSKLEITERAFKEALEQAKDFKIPIHLMKPYKKPGTTLKRFIQHHLTTTKGVMNRTGRILFLSSYKEVIQNARAQLGKRAAANAFKSLSPIGTAVTIGLVLSDPFGALAAETGYPRETWIDLNNHYFQDRDDDEPAPSKSDSVILPDGNAIFVGMPWRMYEFTEVNRPVQQGGTTMSAYPRVDRVLDCVVTHIYPRTLESHGQGVPVKIRVQYTDPHTSLKYRQLLPELIHGLQPESWFDYEEGDVIMSHEGELFYFYQAPTQ